MSMTPLPEPSPVDNGRGTLLLELKKVSMTFGGLRAVDQVSFIVHSGEILGLIGPNGAGKTTLINCVSRIYLPTAGRIRFAGRDLSDVAPHQLADLGLARTFQNVEIFTSLTALDNVLIGTHHRRKTGIFTHMLHLPVGEREERSFIEEALKALDLVGCTAYAQTSVISLPLGLQKRVEVARAIVSRPRLILLDEPASGLNSGEKKELGALVAQLRINLGLSVLLIEHDMDLVMSLCDRLVVLDLGKKIAEGPPEIVRQDPRVIEAYLGETTQEAENYAGSS